MKGSEKEEEVRVGEKRERRGNSFAFCFFLVVGKKVGTRFEVGTGLFLRVCFVR